MNSLANKGFTLIEVLVALTITSLLVAVLMSALFYMFRVQESLHGEIVLREQDLRGKDWFHEALAGCLPMKEKNPAAFVGSPREIRCESTQAIIPERLPVSVDIELGLVNTEEGGVALQYREVREGQRQARPAVALKSWPVRGARFRYIDAQGAELDRWPVEKKRYEALPTLIKLEVELDRNKTEVWLAKPCADPWLPPPRSLPPGITEEMLREMFK